MLQQGELRQQVTQLAVGRVFCDGAERRTVMTDGLQTVAPRASSVLKPMSLCACVCVSALRLAFLTFQHFHSHSGVSGLPFQSECRRLNNFSKLPFAQSFAEYEVFTRKFPLRVLLLNRTQTTILFRFPVWFNRQRRPGEEQLTGILKVSVSMDSCEPRRTLLVGKLMG